jgi:hypothetical protein
MNRSNRFFAWVSVTLLITCISCRQPKEMGALQLNFSGLPGPWADAGYVIVTGAGGSRTAVFDEEPLALEVGDYMITPNLLSICEQS